MTTHFTSEEQIRNLVLKAKALVSMRRCQFKTMEQDMTAAIDYASNVTYPAEKRLNSIKAALEDYSQK